MVISMLTFSVECPPHKRPVQTAYHGTPRSLPATSEREDIWALQPSSVETYQQRQQTKLLERAVGRAVIICQDDLVIMDFCCLRSIQQWMDKEVCLEFISSLMDLWILLCSNWLHGFLFAQSDNGFTRSDLHCLACEPRCPSSGHANLQWILHMAVLLRLQMWFRCEVFHEVRSWLSFWLSLSYPCQFFSRPLRLSYWVR